MYSIPSGNTWWNIKGNSACQVSPRESEKIVKLSTFAFHKFVDRVFHKIVDFGAAMTVTLTMKHVFAAAFTSQNLPSLQVLSFRRLAAGLALYSRNSIPVARSPTCYSASPTALLASPFFLLELRRLPSPAPI